MKKLLPVLLLVSASCFSQPLRDINYEYLYDPDAPLSFFIKPVRGETSFTVLYTLYAKDTADLVNDYTIQWEGREMLSDRQGTSIALRDDLITRTGARLQGRGTVPFAEAPKYLTARVIKNSAKRAWMFFVPLETHAPVNNFLMRNDAIVQEPFVHTDETVKLASDSGAWIVSYYNDNFPAAAPAFSEAQGRVSAKIAVDSVFRVAGGQEINFSRKGLYLVQKDTNSLQGLAFRAEEDYPQYSKLVNLPGPLIYISTRQEYERLETSRGNKKAFDRVILSIATDTERARTLMRNYFRRVELANRYFTSYKEGWKTDRGMIYIIFGKPDQVYRFDDREVWSYKNGRVNIRLDFTRSASLFDPGNFVLLREKKFEDTWYEMIDLWRNARF